MKRIHIRVDDWLKDRLDAFDLSIHDCCRRVIKKIKTGKLILKPVEMGALTHVITADLPDEMTDISPESIRIGLIQIFKNMISLNLKISPEDIKTPYKVICSQNE